jgi:tRNA A-37 threonylcarbamoyl transferase component Bud32
VSSVLVVRFERRSEAAPLVRAALDRAIAYVLLPQSAPAGRTTLQIYLGDKLVAAVAAELVGPGRDGAYPLRLGLLDPAHAEELLALAADPDPAGGGTEAGPRPTRSSPPSASPRPFVDEETTLASRPTDTGLAAAIDGAREGRSVVPPRTPPPPSSSSHAAPRAHDPARARRARSSPPSAPRPEGAAFFTDDESQTLPGSSRAPGVASAEVSWNVRLAPTTRDPLCGRSVGGGKYVLDSVIGTGAIGIVFKASHRDLGRTVAIKVLNPRYRDDVDLLGVFRTEARAASQLEHPNVARVYDYGQEPDGLVYIVMEYLSGYTLGRVLDARRKLTVARSVDVMVQVCAALSAAHERGIVHRDVKPDNIVLVPAQDDEGLPVEIVKVCDFGIAALGTTSAEEGAAAGTPEYMAPEQSTGSKVAPSADVYACGVLLYEMLTGEVPFTADQPFRVLMKHRSEAPRSLSSLEPGIEGALEAVVLCCLEKLPARRYQSARELRLALRRLSTS